MNCYHFMYAGFVCVTQVR